MVDQGLADFFAQAGQVVEHARRQPGLVQNADELPGNDRRLLGRLEDHRVACHERGDRHAAWGSPAGKFQGGMTTATPRGMCSVKLVSPGTSRCLGSARRIISRA